MPQNPNLFNIDFTKFMPQNPYDEGAMNSSVMSDTESDDINADPIRSMLSRQQQYQPHHQFIDMLADAIKNFPQRNQPTRMQNIFGALAGLGTGGPAGHGPAGEPLGYKAGSPQEIFQAQDMVRYRPYYQQLQDWETKLKPMQMGASDERYANMNERIFANDLSRRENDRLRTDIYGRRTEGQINRWEDLTNLGKSNLDYKKEIDAKRLALQQAKQANPGGVPKADNNGNWFILDKNGGAKPVMYNGKQLRTSSDAEKSALILGRMVTGIQKRGEVEEGLIKNRMDARKEFWDWMIANPTAMQDRAGMRNRINAAVAGDPTLGQYFDLEQGIPKPDAMQNVDPGTLWKIFGIVGGKPGSIDIGAPGPGNVVKPAPGKDIELPAPGGKGAVPNKGAGTDWRDDPNQQVIVVGVGPNNKGQRARIRKGTEGGINPALWRVE